eukprot:6663868-Prymnesium_polylepis.1
MQRSDELSAQKSSTLRPATCCRRAGVRTPLEVSRAWVEIRERGLESLQHTPDGRGSGGAARSTR